MAVLPFCFCLFLNDCESRSEKENFFQFDQSLLSAILPAHLISSLKSCLYWITSIFHGWHTPCQKLIRAITCVVILIMKINVIEGMKNMKMFKSTVLAMLLTSLLTTGTVSGQTTKSSKQLDQSQQQTVKQFSSRYIVDFNELLNRGQISFIGVFDREVKVLENALAERDTGGTIIVDRQASKRVPVAQNPAAKIASGETVVSLRGKRIAEN